MTYSIRISYQTGNSFGSEDEEETLPHTWENREIARENLARIKTHYEYYELINKSHISYDKFKEEVLALAAQYKTNDWLLDEYYLNLKTDEGKDYRIQAFWCGYFETLYGASIVDNQELDRFTTGRY